MDLNTNLKKISKNYVVIELTGLKADFIQKLYLTKDELKKAKSAGRITINVSNIEV